MVQRMSGEISMHPAEMVTFEIGEIQVLESGSAEGAVGREVEFFAFRIVD